MNYQSIDTYPMKKYNKKTYGVEPNDKANAIAASKGHTMLDKTFFCLTLKLIKSFYIFF